MNMGSAPPTRAASSAGTWGSPRRRSACSSARSCSPRCSGCWRRWTAAGMLVTEEQFRRIIGYRDLATLVVTIERHSILVAQ